LEFVLKASRSSGSIPIYSRFLPSSAVAAPGSFIPVRAAGFAGFGMSQVCKSLQINDLKPWHRRCFSCLE
jgi:hypothetical protein